MGCLSKNHLRFIEVEKFSFTKTKKRVLGFALISGIYIYLLLASFYCFKILIYSFSQSSYCFYDWWNSQNKQDDDQYCHNQRLDDIATHTA